MTVLREPTESQLEAMERYPEDDLELAQRRSATRPAARRPKQEMTKTKVLEACLGVDLTMASKPKTLERERMNVERDRKRESKS